MDQHIVGEPHGDQALVLYIDLLRQGFHGPSGQAAGPAVGGLLDSCQYPVKETVFLGLGHLVLHPGSRCAGPF